ncbi:MAG: hypothetical protein M0Q23_00940 [Syntrophales bacterium]|jgi:hypothetical protein|nr:hypothetical protein [Syntrophales bacterium]MCK9527214.1 hypothetical protein [Syntrophales bacterium]MDX9921316.1 hypothetical protein [Syntrophales bacterium]
MAKEKIPDELLPSIDGPERAEMARLYAMPVDEAVQCLTEERWPRDIRSSHCRDQFSRWIGVQELKWLKQAYDAGNDAAITEALFTCAVNSLAMPAWLEVALAHSYHKVRRYQAKSWDDVFGKPHPKHIKIEAHRDRLKKRHAVYRKVQELRRDDPSVAIDRGLFDDVGREFCLSGSLVEKFYYEVKNYLERWKNPC